MSAASPNHGTRAAASSTASGLPSSFRHISSTSAALPLPCSKRRSSLRGPQPEQPGGFFDRQRTEAIDRLATAAQWRLARDEDADGGRPCHEGLDGTGQFACEVLRAIQHEQQPQVFERLAQCLEAVAPLRDRDAGSERDRLRHVVERLQGLERHLGGDGIRAAVLEREDLLGEARLADTRGAHERDQPLPLERRSHGLEVGGAPDERT